MINKRMNGRLISRFLTTKIKVPGCQIYLVFGIGNYFANYNIPYYNRVLRVPVCPCPSGRRESIYGMSGWVGSLIKKQFFKTIDDSIFYNSNTGCWLLSRTGADKGPVSRGRNRIGLFSCKTSTYKSKAQSNCSLQWDIYSLRFFFTCLSAQTGTTETKISDLTENDTKNWVKPSRFYLPIYARKSECTYRQPPKSQPSEWLNR